MRACIQGPRHRLITAAWAVVLAFSLGCQRDASETAPAPAPLPEGEQAVRLMILQGPGGTTLALVPVYINDEGPFLFALDTGASHSTIDVNLARELELPVAGPPVETSGVVAVSKALPLAVEKWRVADVELPGKILVSMDMPESNRRIKLKGLLGSDVLSLFGVIRVDYEGQILTLNPN